MLEKHLTEEQIQNMAAGEDIIAGKLHLASCDQCMARLQEYVILFKGLEQQEAPSFDFDLTSLVMDQLQEPSKSKKSFPLVEIIIGMTVVSMLAILIYPGRDWMRGLFRDSMSAFAYLALPAIILALAFFITDMNREYQRNIKLLES